MTDVPSLPESDRLAVASLVARKLEPIIDVARDEVQRSLWVGQFTGHLFRVSDSTGKIHLSRPMLTADASLAGLRFHIRLSATNDGSHAKPQVECGFRVGATGWQPLDVIGLLAFNIETPVAESIDEPHTSASEMSTAAVIADVPTTSRLTPKVSDVNASEAAGTARTWLRKAVNEVSRSEAAGMARTWLREALNEVNLNKKLTGDGITLEFRSLELNSSSTHVRVGMKVLGSGKHSGRETRRLQRLESFFDYHALDIALPPNKDGSPPHWSIIIWPRLPEGFSSQYTSLQELVTTVVTNTIPARAGRQRLWDNEIGTERVRR